MDNRTDQHWGNNIEVLSELLELLRITEEDTLERTTETDTIDTISMALVPAVKNTIEQAVMPKSIVLGLEWFDDKQMKFKDW